MLDAWKEIVIEAPEFYIGWGGLLIGFVFGVVVLRTNFCTMGSISDMLTFGDFRRFRSWLLAIAVALLGVWVLQFLGVLNTADSIYLTPNLGWAAGIVGGLMFGFGMVFAGGCLSKNLVRAGAGDMRSLMVLMMTGVFGFMTIGGLLGPLRVTLFSPLSIDMGNFGLETQGLGEVASNLTGMDLSTASLVVVLLAAGGLLFYCFKDAGFRSSPSHLIAGVGIGLCVVAGWFLTGLAYDEFAPVAPISLSYVRPTGDTLDYLMRFTALGAPGFGVVTLAGALLGGFVGALSNKSFALATFASTQDTYRNMFGSAFMGIGGVLALGCTVGQGLTGISTLAIGSVIAFIAIVIGGIAGIKAMEHLA
ncbi:MAG TPA: YeeE/YedE family protein [Devosia sp.]|nr:YeeE/YedE family protein [Devosia sp.]